MSFSKLVILRWRIWTGTASFLRGKVSQSSVESIHKGFYWFGLPAPASVRCPATRACSRLRRCGWYCGLRCCLSLRVCWGYRRLMLDLVTQFRRMKVSWRNGIVSRMVADSRWWRTYSWERGRERIDRRRTIVCYSWRKCWLGHIWWAQRSGSPRTPPTQIQENKAENKY